jgi:ribosomal protein L29
MAHTKLLRLSQKIAELNERIRELRRENARLRDQVDGPGKNAVIEAALRKAGVANLDKELRALRGLRR